MTRTRIRRPARRPRGDESGAVLILFVFLLLLLMCFGALGVEAGRWFLIRAELSKSVDAAALAGARNMSNPLIDIAQLAREFGTENFPTGYLGTPDAGTGMATFDVRVVGQDKVEVDGHVEATAILSRLLGMDNIPVFSSGLAQVRDVEIMMVLDRSGSMKGTPLEDLKGAGKSFIDFFAESQARDRVGLITFSTWVGVGRPLGTHFVQPVKAAIDAMASDGSTNIEDALDQADGPQGFTDQTDVPAPQRRKQFLILFSDGEPNSYRGKFRYQGNVIDAVGCVTGTCSEKLLGKSTITADKLGYPDRNQWYRFDPRHTGDGMPAPSACGDVATTKWYDLERHPVPGYSAEACDIPPATDLARHICTLAAGYAVQHADELRQKGIIIYVIGLGQLDQGFLEQVASGPDYVYMAPTSGDLEAIFQRVAQEIKLRLVQ